MNKQQQLEQFESLVRRGVGILSELGYTLPPITKLTIGKAVQTFGTCKHDDMKTFAEITITERLFKDGLEDILWNTIMHELCHACKEVVDCHGVTFNIAAERVNQAIGVKITRLVNKEHSARVSSANLSTFKGYLVTCGGCGKQTQKLRNVGIVKSPRNYNCGVCGVSNFKVEKVG